MQIGRRVDRMRVVLWSGERCRRPQQLDIWNTLFAEFDVFVAESNLKGFGITYFGIHNA